MMMKDALTKLIEQLDVVQAHVRLTGYGSDADALVNIGRELSVLLREQDGDLVPDGYACGCVRTKGEWTNRCEQHSITAPPTEPKMNTCPLGHGKDEGQPCSTCADLWQRHALEGERSALQEALKTLEQDIRAYGDGLDGDQFSWSVDSNVSEFADRLSALLADPASRSPEQEQAQR